MAMKAKLYIETAVRNEKTFLRNSYCTPPFKIADVTEDKNQTNLRLMLMSSSPGVLDGDEYELQINLAEKSCLMLQTQSYQRLFQMKIGAIQLIDVKMCRGASFTYLPHPSVPHENSIFFSKNIIHLSEACSLIWGEVMCCGRKLNGEIFKFSSYHNLTEIFQKDKLVVKENLLIKPGKINVCDIGQLEGYTHQATLIYINEEINTSTLVARIVEDLNEQENIDFGVSTLPINGVIVRLLGNRAEQLFDLLKKMAFSFHTSNETIIVKPPAYAV